jgi:hypothetical protein
LTTAYDPGQWSELFVAAAGASAALAGLVFVAVSINIERILQFEGLPERALETVLLLVSVLLVSIVGLVPGQGHVALGIELLVVSTAFGAIIALLLRRGISRETTERSWRLSRAFVAAVGTLPFIVGGASVLVASGGGLYWVAFGIVGAIVGGVSNAWVLLVEILR